MPNENDTSAQHDAIREAMHGLLVCPVDVEKPGLRILDSGTGDGRWLEDLLERYPQLQRATLIGTDISDARFVKKKAPTPIHLEIQSITSPWPREWHGTFDLVQQRLTLGACGSFPFSEAIKNLTELLKPGGWIQLIEPDQTCGVADGPAMCQFIELVTWVFEAMGGHTRYAYSIKQWLQDAGVVDVEERSISLFLGALNPDRDLAERTARSTADAMIPLIRYAEGKGGSSPLSPEELETLVSRLYGELLAQGGYYPLRVIYGRMPDA